MLFLTSIPVRKNNQPIWIESCIFSYTIKHLSNQEKGTFVFKDIYLLGKRISSCDNDDGDYNPLFFDV